MIRGLASLAGLLAIFLMLAAIGARFAESGVARAVYPSPPKPDVTGPGTSRKAAVSNDLEQAMLARWDAERAMAELPRR